MHKLFVASLFLCLAAFAQESSHTSTITFSTGGAWLPGYSAGGPVFDANYEFRLNKYLAVEGGVHNSLSSIHEIGYSIIYPGTTLSGPSSPTTQTFIIPATQRKTSIPAGIKFILPVNKGRGEMFLGLGGGHIWNSMESPDNAWMASGNIGARFAFDKQRHFWLGTSSHYWHEFGLISRNNWVTWTADFSYRFGGK